MELERLGNLIIRYNGFVKVDKYQELFQREKIVSDFDDEEIEIWNTFNKLVN